jgi:tripartite-type tricarboxylate transporter receptor subunit TctC
METKIMKTWKRRDVLGAMLAAPALALPARAQEVWPTKQVTFVVPFSAGGTTDLLARLIGQQMQLKSGKPFVVENRPGAGGNTGSAWVAKQPSDGHTILFCSVSTHAISQFIYPTMPFDPVKDFEPIGLVSELANMLVVNTNKVPVKDYKEFVEFVKANPDKLTFGSSGVGTSQHVAGELFKLKTGTRMQHIPYKSSGEQMNALLGGHLDLTFDNTVTTLPQVQAGGVIKGLAVTSLKRLKVVPDMPAIAEFIPGFQATTWQGLLVPAKTPKPIIDAISAEQHRVYAIPEVQAKFEELGALMPDTSPEKFRDFMVEERKKWSAVVEAANMKQPQ